MKWTTILWAGGSNTEGHAYRTIDIYSDYANTTTTVFTDNTVIGTVDDCIGLHGGNASILRNTIKWCGAPDGDNINVKSGTVGEIAYNVIWGSGGNGIKLNADVTLPRLTNMCIHNNTIVAGGWRRVGELGYAILVDKSARAQIYNNIMGDMYQELEITTKADTVRTVYDNNLFFYSIDSLGGSARYFPSDGVTRQAPHDIIDVHAALSLPAITLTLPPTGSVLTAATIIIRLLHHRPLVMDLRHRQHGSILTSLEISPAIKTWAPSASM